MTTRRVASRFALVGSRRTILRVAAVCLAAGACKPASDEDAPEPPAPPTAVLCAAARAADAAEQLSVRGVVRVPPDRHAVVAPSAAGRVLEIHVREGDHVAAGALLAVIRAPGADSAVAEADASAASAAAAASNASAALARLRRLVEQGIAAQREVDEAQARVAAADAEVKSARARRGLAGTQREHTHVRAPIAGTVIRVFRRAGELVDGTPATPIVELADRTRLELEADVPAAQLVRLTAGAHAEVHLDALPAVTIAGRLVWTSPAVDPATALGSARIELQPPADPESHLALGLAGQALIEAGAPRDGVRVPIAALRRSPTGTDQLVVCGSGPAPKAEVREVQVAARDAREAFVLTGVEAGERVAVTHHLRLEDGDPIVPANAPASPAAELAP